ncbi:hypothetical protein PITC_017460 [Penicillium italicum]|uniref:Uncharacterized protein n=1 Tax=Penicillium italicum TaxID=40296 RepID=A0A0A2KXJ5_PENIT|nr:hypothetical protein PITC_017460 [Penicillium italicum]
MFVAFLSKRSAFFESKIRLKTFRFIRLAKHLAGRPGRVSKSP